MQHPGDCTMALDSPLTFGTDFALYCCKIVPCSKKFAHDWAMCPFAHPGEKATRRCPALYAYTVDADICPYIRKQQRCPDGDACSSPHNLFELYMHPARFSTLPCSRPDDCPRHTCFFAHPPRQPLRTPCLPDASAALAARAPFMAGRELTASRFALYPEQLPLVLRQAWRLPGQQPQASMQPPVPQVAPLPPGQQVQWAQQPGQPPQAVQPPQVVPQQVQWVQQQAQVMQPQWLQQPVMLEQVMPVSGGQVLWDGAVGMLPLQPLQPLQPQQQQQQQPQVVYVAVPAATAMPSSSGNLQQPPVAMAAPGALPLQGHMLPAAAGQQWLQQVPAGGAVSPGVVAAPVRPQWVQQQLGPAGVADFGGLVASYSIPMAIPAGDASPLGMMTQQSTSAAAAPAAAQVLCSVNHDGSVWSTMVPLATAQQPPAPLLMQLPGVGSGVISTAASSDSGSSGFAAWQPAPVLTQQQPQQPPPPQHVVLQQRQQQQLSRFAGATSPRPGSPGTGVWFGPQLQLPPQDAPACQHPGQQQATTQAGSSCGGTPAGYSPGPAATVFYGDDSLAETLCRVRLASEAEVAAGGCGFGAPGGSPVSFAGSGSAVCSPCGAAEGFAGPDGGAAAPEASPVVSMVQPVQYQ